MNVRAMLAAAALRRSHEERHGGPTFALAVRVRPDDIWRFGTEAQVAELWDCLQLMLAVRPPSPPRASSSSSQPQLWRGERGLRRAASRHVSAAPAEAWRHVNDAVSSCAERDMGFDTSDNCLLGRPRCPTLPRPRLGL